MKDFADDHFNFDKNSRKLFKPVENTVGKGEIAHYEQFLLFPQCFQKAYFPGVSKGVIVWEWVKLEEFADTNFEFDGNGRNFSKSVENTLAKGEIVCNDQFLFFPSCFKKTCTAGTLKPGLV